MAAAEALVATLDEYPDTIQVIVVLIFDGAISICILLLFLSHIQESLAMLFSLYICDTGLEGSVDGQWLGREGVALALHSAADVL